jgi:hypothetical protein
VFLLRKLAQDWSRPAPEVYRMLRDAAIIPDYLFGAYGTLHTQRT